jgi:hypothetical protein
MTQESDALDVIYDEVTAADIEIDDAIESLLKEIAQLREGRDALRAEVHRLRGLADGRLEIIHMLRDSIELYDGARTAALKVQP